MRSATAAVIRAALVDAVSVHDAMLTAAEVDGSGASKAAKATFRRRLEKAQHALDMLDNEPAGVST